VNTRQILIIVPLAALLGIGAALSFYYLADRSSSKLPAFQVQLAGQSVKGATANHSPTTNAAERRAKELRDARRARAIRRARAARASARAAAVALADRQTRSSSAATIETAGTPSQAQPAPTTPDFKPAPKPAPRPAPAPRRTSSGGGGGSFDDSG
jgi:hypothetical protein